MEEDCGVSDQSIEITGSGKKAIVGGKRGCAEIEERTELCHKRVKMRDLESVLRREEKTEIGTGKLVTDPALRLIDLNANVVASSNAIASHVDETNKLVSLGKKYNGPEGDSMKSKGFALDLNAEDVSSSINHESSFPCKNSAYLKSKDDFECASSVGPLDENESMRIWNEMKQNGFLSHTHGGAPMPKVQGRKSKTDGMKKKMELAKKERVDRFAKIAAPSGLLNGLNPGIINHVRNSKQVHSIIEALVRSEKSENAHGRSKNQTKKDHGERTKDQENNDGPGASKFSPALEDLPGSSGYLTSLKKSIALSPVFTGGDGDSCMVGTRVTGKMVYHSNPNVDTEHDALALKLSSSTTIASDNTSSLSNEESANLASVNSLSIKAANVASQWLELLHQDIKGRLAALRRSKRRVRAVIQTEFPCLFSREFSSNQENSSYGTQSSSVGHFDNATAHAHRARWTALFDQMEKALSEEERQLESWLNQVKQMQLQCEQGLQKYGAPYGLQQLGLLQNDCRLEKPESSETDLAVRAAAASIYSTCNFLSSMENQPCY
ncbi:uncharacterized protein LOC132611251 isoform X1 [Lycium barbarum]|uniref:uncharacterized protein LOC132611251 isoform X1 n=1 Tax=Lycium barbarum TaxID=112863 RepID=UPI00293E7B61|nr:uncharacterized protein LOC132611251 isoform X1 [Lycium barbarum]